MIARARKDLEIVLEHVSAEDLHGPIKTEVKRLYRLIATESELLGLARSGNTKTADKVAFIREELEARKGGIRKSELLELAGSRFDCDPAPTFLDTALRVGGFVKTREPEGRQVVISLH